MPPTSACEDELGMPNHQVMRFQVMAPTSAAMMTTSLTILADCTMSPPIVLATPVLIIAPAKFNTADMMIATAGGTARVDTQVAMALAVSWKPFTKSKAKARIITRNMRILAFSSILHNNSF